MRSNDWLHHIMSCHVMSCHVSLLPAAVTDEEEDDERMDFRAGAAYEGAIFDELPPRPLLQLLPL